MHCEKWVPSFDCSVVLVMLEPQQDSAPFSVPRDTSSQLTNLQLQSVEVSAESIAPRVSSTDAAAMSELC